MFENFGAPGPELEKYISVFYCVYWLWLTAFAIKSQYKYQVTAHTPFVVFPVSVQDPEWIGLHMRDGYEYMFVFLQSMMTICLLLLVWMLTMVFWPTVLVVFGYTWYWFCVHWPRIYKAVQERDRRYV